MKKHINKITLITILALLVVIFIMAFQIKNLNKKMVNSTQEDTSNSEVQEGCPYTSGVQYRQCLFDFSEKTYKEVDTTYAQLVKEVNIVIEEDLKRKNEDSDNTARRDFLENLENYNKNWKSYIELYCGLDASIFWGGTGQGEVITMCEIDEAKQYITRLEDFKDSWVMSMVRDDVENNVIPKTEQYKLLMNK